MIKAGYTKGLREGSGLANSEHGSTEVQKSHESRLKSTGPLAHPFACSLAPLTHLFAPHCLLCSCVPLRPFDCSLTLPLPTPELMEKWMIGWLQIRLFWTIVGSLFLPGYDNKSLQWFLLSAISAVRNLTYHVTNLSRDQLIGRREREKTDGIMRGEGGYWVARVGND